MILIEYYMYMESHDQEFFVYFGKKDKYREPSYTTRFETDMGDFIFYSYIDENTKNRNYGDDTLMIKKLSDAFVNKIKEYVDEHGYNPKLI